MRTQVAIVGAGPAGLLLGELLHVAGIEAVVLEARDRAYVEARIRAGVLEQGTVELLRAAGVAGRLEREGLVHEGLELRVDGEGHRIDLAGLTGGRTVTVYGQTEVVKDLLQARDGHGAPLLFEVADVALHDTATAAPRVTFTHAGAAHELRADVVVGADGFHGPSRASLPAGAVLTWEREYPFAWLGILAAAPPAVDELVYARHEHGFALHSMRSPDVSRLYLQVAPGEDLADWPDDRVWEELALRLGLDGALNTGPVLDKAVTPMRSFVAAPLRHGRLLLAGDAAHIVPPTGAKGLNLAASDVGLLAEALVALLRRGDEALLDAYSDAALRRVWRAEHFAWWMTTMLHVDPAASPFDRRLQRAQLDYVRSSRAAATTLAENYAGLW